MTTEKSPSYNILIIIFIIIIIFFNGVIVIIVIMNTIIVKFYNFERFVFSGNYGKFWFLLSITVS